MTIKLFYNNPYITEFTTEIRKSKLINNKYHIVLKETAFYPEGGGQPCDLGEIDGVKVEYVYEAKDVIYHVVNTEIKKDYVFCTIDFKRRLDHMQQHSGEHILSAILLKLYEGKNIGFHLGNEYSTLDITLPSVSKEMIAEVEKSSNEIIYKNLPIKCYTVDKDTLSSIPIRKETSIEENIRIVEIKDSDFSACCGTHVNTTGEIGLIKIIKTEKYKGNTRVYFKCGERALSDFSFKHNVITDLMRILSADEKSIISSVLSLTNTIKENNKYIRELKEIMYKNEADTLIKGFNDRLYKQVFQDKSFEDINNLGKLIAEENICVLMCTTKDNMILFSSSVDLPINCGELFKNLIGKFNGKGGGSINRAQGSFSSTEDLLKFYYYIESYVNNI